MDNHMSKPSSLYFIWAEESFLTELREANNSIEAFVVSILLAFEMSTKSLLTIAFEHFDLI